MLPQYLAIALMIFAPRFSGVLSPSVAKIISASHFCAFVQFQPAQEVPPDRKPDPPDPPKPALKKAEVDSDWAKAESADLLKIMKLVLKDDEAVSQYLRKEDEQRPDEFERVRLRTRFIQSFLEKR